MSHFPDPGGAEGAASSLEIATKLVRGDRCGVGGRALPRRRRSGWNVPVSDRPGRCAVPGRRSIRIASASEAQRRARTKVRRYVAANRLDRLGTLTYRGDGLHDERALASARRATSSGVCVANLVARHSRTSGCRSGTRRTTACTCTSQSVGTSISGACRRRGVEASCTSSALGRGTRPARWRRLVAPRATSRSTSASRSTRRADSWSASLRGRARVRAEGGADRRNESRRGDPSCVRADGPRAGATVVFDEAKEWKGPPAVWVGWDD